MATSITVPLQLTGDSITNYNGLTASQSLVDASILIQLSAGTAPLTAYVLNVTPVETDQGAPSFVYNPSRDIFHWTFLNSFPQSLVISPSGIQSSTFNLSLTATGDPCALGQIPLSYIVTLSSGALSGNNVGQNVYCNVLNTTDTTLSTVITATNTPFGGRICQDNFLRLRALGYF